MTDNGYFFMVDPVKRMINASVLQGPGLPSRAADATFAITDMSEVLFIAQPRSTSGRRRGSLRYFPQLPHRDRLTRYEG